MKELTVKNDLKMMNKIQILSETKKQEEKLEIMLQFQEDLENVERIEEMLQNQYLTLFPKYISKI